jgi:glyoxylase-like metal-dependent hydrolase (beta-lactamase superfamily II)
MPRMHWSDILFFRGFPLRRPCSLFRSGTVLRRLVTVALLGWLGTVQATSCGDGAKALLSVLPGLSVVHGRWPALDPLTPDHVVTTVLLVQGREVTVLDPGPSQAQGLWLQRSLRCGPGQRVVRLINSHAHAEQTLANAAFAAPVAATALTAAAMRGRCPDCLASMRADLGAAALRGTRIRLPTQVLHDGQTMQMGGRAWQVLEMRHAHTESDLVLWNADEQIALAGPLVDGARLVLAQGSLQGWLDALDRLSTLKPRWLIGQHIVAQGDEVPTALAHQRQAICQWVRRAWQGLEQGWTEAEALQHWLASAERVGTEADQRLQRFNLLRAWREMEERWLSLQTMPQACSTPDVGG